MNTSANAYDTELSLGKQFRQARETLNLSLDEVSKIIQLRPSILQQIENDEWVQPHIAPIFMRGYVQSYARFLKLPNELWQSFNFGTTQKNDLNRNARAKIAGNPHSAYGRWIGYFTLLVLLIVAGMTALWWWQNHQKSNAERDALVQNYTTENVQTTQAGNEQSVPMDVQPVLVEPTSTSNELSEKTQVVESQAIPTQTSLQSAAEKSTENTVRAIETPSVVKSELQIEVIAASSWISVKDGKRKNLVQQEYKQGEILTFDGQGPYSLTIGAPANVKITYKGEAYPLTIDGRVARFKLQ